MTNWRTPQDGEAEWLADPLRFLLDPMSPADFVRDHYEQSRALISRQEPERYCDLLSIEAIDAFIDGADIRSGMLDLVRSTGRIAADRYISTDGRVIASAVAAEYLNGATIILPQLHESMPRLGHFCRALESVMSCHVQTNVYLTPPGNQGFATHYDNHDVFVMQISGAKNWRFYSTPVSIPYRGEGFVSGQHASGEVAGECVLQPGDCLYVPRGLMHDAPNAGDEPSLHITVGLITRTWADLMLEAVSELALREPAFRRSLPLGFARGDFDRTDAREQFAVLLSIIKDQAELDNAFDLLAHSFLRDRRPQVAGVIAAGAEALGPDTLFRRRPLTPWQIADDEGKPTVVGPGGDLSFDPSDGEALERALSGAPFRLADLHCPDPARILRRLWGHGYLERIPNRG
jgi:bifunctional lysine-specific demethylase and histidyl-hydroxylase NO66